MSTKKTIYAVPGRRIRVHETGEIVSAAGTPVIWSSLWQRRLNAGDIALAPAESKSPTEGATEDPAAASELSAQEGTQAPATPNADADANRDGSSSKDAVSGKTAAKK